MIARTVYRSVLSAMLMAMLVVGCAKRTAHDASVPPTAGEVDELTELEQQLAQRERELQAVGISPVARNPTTLESGNDATMAKPAAGTTGSSRDFTAAVPSTGPAPSGAPPADAERGPDDPGRCERVCEISAAICTLKEQICGLLPRHPGEARYQDACDRSVADCDLATEACHACTAN